MVLDELSTYLGVTTNNIAEYSAILAALNWIVQNKSQMPSLTKINFFMDSQLASSQLNGLYKIKNPKLRELLFAAKQKEVEIGLPVYYSHVPREQNKKADALVNKALDENQLKA
jgi:ribonuclease HI